MNKKYLMCILLCVMFVLFGCTAEEEPRLTEEQLSCEHEWVEIAYHVMSYSDGSGVGYDVYCPKCHLEEGMSSKEWNRTQADMEYKNSK